jgi:hypothetical protein
MLVHCTGTPSVLKFNLEEPPLAMVESLNINECQSPIYNDVLKQTCKPSAMSLPVRDEFLRTAFTPVDPNSLLEDQQVCHICQEHYINPSEGEDKEAVVRLPCGHTFGERCIRRWFSTTDADYFYNRNCPFRCQLIRRTDRDAVPPQPHQGTQSTRHRRSFLSLHDNGSPLPRLGHTADLITAIDDLDASIRRLRRRERLFRINIQTLQMDIQLLQITLQPPRRATAASRHGRSRRESSRPSTAPFGEVHDLAAAINSIDAEMEELRQRELILQRSQRAPSHGGDRSLGTVPRPDYFHRPSHDFNDYPRPSRRPSTTADLVQAIDDIYAAIEVLRGRERRRLNSRNPRLPD